MESAEGKRVVTEEELIRLLGDEGITVESSLPIDEQLLGPLRHDGFEALPLAGWLMLEHAAENCKAYLAGLLFNDPLEQAARHQERRAWRHQMTRIHGAPFERLYEKNKFGLNNVMGVVSMLEGLVSVLDLHAIHTPQAERVRSIARMPPQGLTQESYAALSQDEKRAIVNQTDEMARAFLCVVTGSEHVGV